MNKRATRKVLEGRAYDRRYRPVFEINEAFAVVAEKYIRDPQSRSRQAQRQWRLDPIDATGSILIGTLLDELERAI